MKKWLKIFILTVIFCSPWPLWAGPKTYVGSKRCAECHEQEYQNWT